MDDLALGRLVRAARTHGRERQADLAKRTGLSQSMISRVEHGRLDRIRIPDLRRLCSALEVRLRLDASWRGIEGERLADRAHAAIVEQVVHALVRHGWEVIVEYSFNHYGERGSVDIVAWRADFAALATIEVKTLIPNIQAMVAAIDRKARVVPLLLARERGWIPQRAARLLVVRGSDAARRAIKRHEATFRSAFPARTVDVRRWISSPADNIAGLMFVADSSPRNTRRRSSGEKDASSETEA